MVIDPTTNTLYAVTAVETTASRTDRTGTYSPATIQQYLHSINLLTGAENPGSPVLINPTFAGSANFNGNSNNAPQGTPSINEQSGTTNATTTGVIPFYALNEHARAALTLYNNTVFITYASHTDNEVYHGEILGYNASTLVLTNKFIATPNGAEGGIWDGGANPAIDANGNMYVMTGNGDWDQASSPYTAETDFAMSFLKLPTNATGQYSCNFLDPTTYFTPNAWSTLNNGDLDIGAGGCTLLTNLAGPHSNLVVGGGKGATIYVLDAATMGGNQSPDAVVQEFEEQGGKAMFCTPAYFNGYLYYAPSGWSLEQRAVGYNSTTKSYIADPPTFQSPTNDTYAVKGSNPFITANGTQNGLVWMENGNLRVYNAANVSSGPIYQSGPFTGTTAKFIVPTVANGKVYCTSYQTNSGATANTFSNLLVYGLLQQFTTVPSPAPTSLTATTASSSSIQLAWSNTATDLGGFHVWRSTSATGTFTDITPSGVPSNTTTFTDTGLASGTTYFYFVTSFNNVGDSSPTSTVSTKTLTVYTANGLVAYLPFDEGTGTTTADTTGNGNNGTLPGAEPPTWVTGLINSALEFHGTNSAGHVEVANAPSLQFGANQSYTIGAWVNVTNGNTGKEQEVINKSADQGNEYGLLINAAGDWVFRGGSSSSPVDVVGPAAVSNTWTFVCGVQDAVAGTRTLYINGVAVASSTTLEPGDGTGDLWIGAQNLAAPNDNSYQGLIDEVRVYNIAIQPGQMADQMAPPVLQALSNQAHGGAGTFGIQISPYVSVVAEPRKGSTIGSYSIVLTFSCPVAKNIVATLQTQSGGTGIGTVGTITYDSTGAIVTVPLTGVANLQALDLHLSNITPGGAPVGLVTATADIPFNILWGDVNQNGYVDYLDVAISTGAQGQNVTGANFMDDVDCNGTLNSADTTIINSEAGSNIGPVLDTNMALFQPASDSSSLQAPSLAFDNNLTGTRWETTHGIDPGWLEVDLGSICAIHSITIYWEDAKAADYFLQSSTDNQTWTNLMPEVTDNTSGGNTSQTFNGLTGSGRYVRMYGLARSTGFGYSAFEMQVDGQLGSHTVNPAPSITGDTAFYVTQGVPVSGITIGASNSPTNFSATGLPTGLTINAASGAITGTPSVNGVITSEVTATNGNGNSAVTPLIFTIAASSEAVPVVSATPAPPAGTVGTIYSYQITASNSPTTYNVSAGGLPAGLNLSDTGLITGTPTATGSSTFSITASNGTTRRAGKLHDRYRCGGRRRACHQCDPGSASGHGRHGLQLHPIGDQ